MLLSFYPLKHLAGSAKNRVDSAFAPPRNTRLTAATGFLAWNSTWDDAPTPEAKVTSSVRKYSAPHNGDAPASGGKDGDIEIQQKVRRLLYRLRSWEACASAVFGDGSATARRKYCLRSKSCPNRRVLVVQVPPPLSTMPRYS